MRSIISSVIILSALIMASSSSRFLTSARVWSEDIELRLNLLVVGIEALKNKTILVQNILSLSNTSLSAGNWDYSTTLEDKTISALFPKEFFYLILQNLSGKVIQKFEKLDEIILNKAGRSVPRGYESKEATPSAFPNQIETFQSFLRASDSLLDDDQRTIVAMATGNNTQVIIKDRIDTEFVGFLVKVQLMIDNLNQNIDVLHKLTNLIISHPTIESISSVLSVLGLDFKFNGNENILVSGLGDPDNFFNKFDLTETNIAEDTSKPLSFNSTFKFTN